MYLALGLGFFAANLVGGFGFTAVSMGDAVQLRSAGADQTPLAAVLGLGVLAVAVLLAFIFYAAYAAPLFRLAGARVEPHKGS